MEWNDIEEILKIPEKEWEKEIYKMPVNMISERIEKLRNVTIKPDLGMPLLIASEREPKRKQLLTIQHLLESIRDKKLKEDFMQDRKLAEKWRDETLPKVLGDLRYVVGTDAEHLMHGTFTLDAVQPKKFPSLEFEIPLTSGGKKKIDLRKVISPPILKMLLERTMSSVYITVEPTGAYQHGKKLGYFVSGEWDQTRGIELRMGTLLAIMRV
jgi:hypothetical protein